MKKPLLIAATIILGIILSNVLIGEKKEVTETLVEDSIGTSQAATKQVNIPL